jgi:nucleoside-diphosphate-sugar epimerase
MTQEIKKKLFVFGLGFTGTRAAISFYKTQGFEIAGTSRTIESARKLVEEKKDFFHLEDEEDKQKRNVFVFGDGKWDLELNNQITVEQALKGTTHLIISVPTGSKEGEEDPVLFALRHQLVSTIQETIQWVAYLSTIGVYGETNGQIVDETAPVQSNVRRSQFRIVAEKLWLETTNLPIHLFRIAGIYGPGRGTITKIRSGTASRIHIPGRMFNRIHVDDIVNILQASAAHPNPGGIYNVCDDEPAPNDQVVAYGCELLGIQPPPLQTWEEAEQNMSAMAKSFYAESKICKNERIKNELGVILLYPTYREGFLAQILEEEEKEETFLCKNVVVHKKKKTIGMVVNIGSLRAEPFLDLRQICFRLSRTLRMPIIPCSFRFSNRIDPIFLHGIPAKTFQEVLVEILFTSSSSSCTKEIINEEEIEVVLLPLFFGKSSTLTDFLPNTLSTICQENKKILNQQFHVRLGKCLIDLERPQDDRIAQILEEKIFSLLSFGSQESKEKEKQVSVLVVDHGTPNYKVHLARELVKEQLKKRLSCNLNQNQINFVGTACMERRQGIEYDFNDPLLENCLEYHQIQSGIVIMALLFLSNGRHAGEKGDIEEILTQLKQDTEKKGYKVDIRVTQAIGTHPLVTDILKDRFQEALLSDDDSILIKK